MEKEQINVISYHSLRRVGPTTSVTCTKNTNPNSSASFIKGEEFAINVQRLWNDRLAVWPWNQFPPKEPRYATFDSLEELNQYFEKT